MLTTPQMYCMENTGTNIVDFRPLSFVQEGSLQLQGGVEVEHAYFRV